MTSRRVAGVKPFQVMEILARAQRMEREGKRVIHFEIGEPDFVTPQRIRESAVQAINRGFTHYTESAGLLKLREALASHLEFTGRRFDSNSEIIVTGGVSQALFFALASLLDPGDEVIMTDPHYPCYPNFVCFLDAKPVYTSLTDDFKLDMEDLKEKISSRTKAILVNTPSNPTGMFLELKELRELAEIAEDSNSYVLSDEIYSGLVYDGRHRSPSILETGYDKVVMLDGFSKLYSMTGWRVGYVVCEPELAAEVLKLQQNFYISPSSFVQHAAVTALECRDEVRAMLDEFARRREYIVGRLQEMEGFKVKEPNAAYYIFPDVKAISEDSTKLSSYLLKEARVAVTPGIAFGRRGEGHLRFSYATSIENIKEGMNRIEKALKKFS
ncbi:MAG: pyridoxal phosphate-dependent aminotransferase [Candidatus Hydrothermarchaeales archaeon]